MPKGSMAEIKESIQIRRLGDESRTPKVDLVLLDLDPHRPHAPTPAFDLGGQLIALEALVEENEDREHPYSAIALYEHPSELGYRQAFEEGLYSYSVDYAQLSLHFDRYTPADQARIAARMVAVLCVARAGGDLEAAPLPVEDIPLAEIAQGAGG